MESKIKRSSRSVFLFLRMSTNAQKNIVLVGFMGTGKTTIGQLLAERTGMELVDMDSIIVNRAGKSINDLFAEDGEPHFRQLERLLTKELAQKRGLIVSTGGGVVLNPGNISDYSKSGLVVCLLASAETILERIQHDRSRPLLAGDKQEKIVQLLESRKTLYEAIPHKVATDGLTPKQIADQIIMQYNEFHS